MPAQPRSGDDPDPVRAGADVAAVKARLREGARVRRAAIAPADRRRAGVGIRATVAELIGGLSGVGSVGLYAALPAEVDLDPLVAPLRAGGVVVAYPRVTGDRAMAFHAVDAPPAAPGPWGVREPAAGARTVERLDLVVVPGLAYDRDGGRLGHGAGFYDRWLAEHRPLAVGVCPEALLVDAVPVEAHDVRVDAVVTEHAVYPGADMPTYEYECLTNGHRFEVKQSFSDDPLQTCEVCGEPVRKVFSAAGIVFKGSGYYVTDTRKKPASSSKNGGGSETGGSKEKAAETTSSSTKSSTSDSSSGSSSSSTAD
ncbi:5-formyltetrahydrofolate cyclo-ligase [Euzebya sp.]|uniref:5-formyltetrahydrofolate cyclo-ligase n=1 Tax=Euzebya sp. TaxID=1971409 RepID=UPI00351739F4